MYKTKDIRKAFIDLKSNSSISDDGNYELINVNFIANEETIFGKLNEQYAKAEWNWYKSKSLDIRDIPGKIPGIWKDICSINHEVNSNYGWCILSKENYQQYFNCLIELKRNKYSRRACMIYNRPSIYEDYDKEGMNDFICTYSTQLLIRDNKLHYLVYMRSNDAIFGYKNDRFWHDKIFMNCYRVLSKHYPDLEKGNLYWNCASLHIYPRHFDLIK